MLFEADKSINRNICIFNHKRVNTKKDNFILYYQIVEENGGNRKEEETCLFY